jgi:L-ascorbate metabolism protein UlaG (beta-lactamase superfamily)
MAEIGLSISVTLQYVNAIHSSSFPDGSYGGQPGGFILSSSEGTVYIAGDTALTYDMKLYR